MELLQNCSIWYDYLSKIYYLLNLFNPKKSRSMYKSIKYSFNILLSYKHIFSLFHPKYILL